MTSFLAYGIRLALVLRHAGMHSPETCCQPKSLSTLLVGFALNNVRTDGRLEDIWQRMRVGRGFAIRRYDRHNGAARHRGRVSECAAMFVN